MKRIYLFMLIALFLAGCGGGGNKTPKPQYSIEISVADSASGSSSMTLKSSSFISQGIDTAGDPVSKSSDWYKAKTSEDHLFGANFIWDDAVRGAGAQATIYNAEGQLVELSYQEAEESIVWTCSDSSKFYLSGDLNMTGGSVTFVAEDTGVIYFTATYTYTVEGQVFTTTARANVIIIDRPQIDLGGTYADFPDGFDFANELGTTLANSDIYYTKEDGINYINAPGGISKILGVEYLPPTGTEPTISPYTLGSILKVPEGMVFETKILAEPWTAYIVKPRTGSGYAKVFNTVSTDQTIQQLLGLQYEYSPTGEFQLHW